MEKTYPKVTNPTVLSPEEKSTEVAQKALLERPSIGFRFRIILGFSLCFLLSGAAIFTSLFIISQIQKKMYFLEAAGEYSLEIQQARRFEKNFFLYGTNLGDALENIYAARGVLESDPDKFKSVIGEKNFTNMLDHLENYEKLLKLLMSNKDPNKKHEIELDLREHGSQMVLHAMELVKKERQSVQKMLQMSKRLPLGFLIVLLALIIYYANFLAQQMMGTLSRFVDYTRRIAKGDFSPILPTRRYRDEFTNLGIAINIMLDQLKKHQEELVQSRKMAALGVLTSGIAHELNNPLNNISITTESLLDEFESLSKAEIRKRLNDIYTQTERATATVRNLLDFTRKEEPSFVPLKINEVLKATLRLMENEIALNNIRLETNLNDNLPEIRGDFSQLQQVFLNLILNAIQAMERGGTLSIVSQIEDNSYVRVDITDTGVGIPETILPNIFDPFFTTKEIGKGTGLGLSVSYNIIQKHGGKISVKSKVNQGTTFSVYLPKHRKDITA
jgi:signal transduction histidine kinase